MSVSKNKHYLEKYQTKYIKTFCDLKFVYEKIKCKESKRLKKKSFYLPSKKEIWFEKSNVLEKNPEGHVLQKFNSPAPLVCDTVYPASPGLIFEKSTDPKFSEAGTSKVDLSVATGNTGRKKGEGNTITKKSNLEKIVSSLKHDHTYAKKISNAKRNPGKRDGVKKAGSKNIKIKPICPKNISNCHKIKILGLNVGGLKSKLYFEDFEEEINSFDIICLLEVKLDQNDVGVLEKELNDFKIFTNIEDEYKVNPRGGIMILVKNYLSENVTLIPKINNLTCTVQINSKILEMEENVLLSAIYIPPINSLYSKNDDFELLEEYINNLQLSNNNIILMGDFNAKTKNLTDYLILNENDELSQLDGIFDQKYVKIKRISQDAHELDSFGHKLLNMCKVLNLQIANGRIGKDRGVGKHTTIHDSIIDYVLATPELFEEIKDFEIMEFNPILSDVHCPIIFSLLSRSGETKIQNQSEKRLKIKWDGTKNSDFLTNIDDSKIENLNNLLDDFSASNNTNDKQVDLFVKITTDILNEAKEKTFQPKIQKHFRKKRKSWYDGELTVAKNKFHAARKQKNRTNIRNSSKVYKSLLKSKFSIFNQRRSKNLKQLKVKNPKLYWDMIQGNTKGNSTVDISVEKFGTFFKNLNVQEEADTSNIRMENENKNPYEELNKPFSDNELKTALKNLKNNKATGEDEVLNEQIKNSFPKMKNIYLKLFNIILNTGCFPESWAIGLIVPIFKNKGSKNDPNNYRGITLLSCLAKYFNIVLNNRLKAVGDKILSLIQAGFRPGFSTMDHIFTLLCILTLYERLQKNLFIAFIDYQKAFDTVWRAGLWLKLINEGVSGKFLNVVKDMYSKSKSCVFINNEKSSYFGSYAGVRQGEILSPLLFALYINDLEGFLKAKGITSLRGLLNISGEVADFNDYDIKFFIDILTLFYADDTIIFADTAIGLQFALEELQNYCEKWKLTVNEDKTKIMCITWGRDGKETFDFVYNNKKLEVVNEFTYLGICFTKKGLTNKTVSCRETASKKAMFSFLNRCKQNYVPIEDQLDVFRKTVVPCMCYGAEMWGFNNIDCLERVQKKFLKYALKLKASTPTAMVYGETGYLTIETEIKIRTITFWVNLLTGRKDKFSYKLYLICLSLFKRKLLIFRWLEYIVKILNDTGFSFIFENQLALDEKYLKNIFLTKIKTRIRDQAIQTLFATITEAEFNFKLYPDLIACHGIQNYLKKMPPDIWIPIIKIRTSNHKLPIEFHSWKIVFKPRLERVCSICDTGELGNEIHFVMNCPVFEEERKIFIPSIINDKSENSFINLLKSEDIKILRGLAKFLNVLFGVFE